MNSTSLLTWIQIISAIVSPLVVLILGARFANSAKRQEKLYEMQVQLQDDRIQVYNSILEPFIIMSTPDAILQKEKKYHGKTPAVAAGEILSTKEWKIAETKLFLMGTDDVVMAYLQVKRFLLSRGPDGTDESTKRMLRLLVTLVLEIRKSVRNENTKVSQIETARLFVIDPEKVFDS
jgi:hypothetical protein